MYDPNIPPKPPAPNLYTQERWKHTSLRNRLISGTWEEDLHQEMQKHFNESRRAIIGIEDMSSNIFKSVCVALNALYNEPPSISALEEKNSSAQFLLGKEGYLSKGGLWPIMQRVLLYTIACREMFLKISVHDNKLVFIPIVPDMIFAESSAQNPMNPIMISELQLRKHKDKKIWTYDYYSIEDPEFPIYKICKAEKDGSFGEDLTLEFENKFYTGLDYPWRNKEGVPFLPYVCYHAQLTGDKLFDAFTNSSLVSGSLVSAAMHTFLLHMMKSASFPQRYVLGCTIDGGNLYDSANNTRRTAIASDPTSILVFSPDQEMQGLGQPIIGQFNDSSDIKKMMETIVTYDRKLATQGGIKGGSVQKLSGDPRSGYAIAMSRSDQREFQRRFKFSMEKGDLETISKSAMICNRFLDTNFPEDNYGIEYQTIPLSKEELDGIRKDIIEKQQAGYLTKVDALRAFHPGMSKEEAIEYLKEVRLQNIEFNNPIS